MKKLYIKMFGECVIQSEDAVLSSHNDRSKKVWIVLIYLLTHRDQAVSRRTLIDLLWHSESAGANPENSLKAIMYRVRALLNQLWPSAGHELIQYRKDGYLWNPEVPTVIDAWEFESLCKRECETDDERISAVMDAMSMYRGEFLEDFASEAWVRPQTVYFHNLFIRSVLEIIPMLVERGRHRDVIEVCKGALREESLHEPLHQHLMQALLAQGDFEATTKVYEKLSQQMFEEFGRRPSEETVALYRMALQTIRNEHLSMHEVMTYLEEQEADGALECDYDYFKVICHAEARMTRRTRIPAQVALLSVSGFGGKELSKRSLDLAMEHLGQKIRGELRQSDTFARCSIAQYTLLLSQTSYENGCQVCRRIVNSYMKKYPSSPVEIRYTVEPLVAEKSRESR